MPHVKPANEKLNDSINTPVNRNLKRLVKQIAKAKQMRSHTPLSREYIERCAMKDAKELGIAVDA